MPSRLPLMTMRTMRAGGALAAIAIFLPLRGRCDTYFRRHPWRWVRTAHKWWTVHSFALRLELACCLLPAPLEATNSFRGGGKIIDSILSAGPNTYQKKASNLEQIVSLIDCVADLLPFVRRNSKAVAVVDLGAGKALLTRTVYEALERRVAVIALDCRRETQRDRFYDPPPAECGAAAYTRVVGDVADLAQIKLPLPSAAHGGVIALAKHLCGGATDASLHALCEQPLAAFVGACCIAPCCHQKARADEYCNPSYLAAAGFGADPRVRTRRGVPSANEFKTLQMLVQISKAAHAADFAKYEKSNFLRVLGFRWCHRLGRLARRLLEEGRLRHLRAAGFDAHLVRYCDAAVTPDNLAIIATRRREQSDDEEAQCAPCR